MILYVWSWIFPLLVAVVIAMNRWTHWPHSWGVGALAQAGQIVVALMFREVEGYQLSVVPLIMFVAAWITAVREARSREQQGA